MLPDPDTEYKNKHNNNSTWDKMHQFVSDTDITDRDDDNDDDNDNTLDKYTVL